MKNYKKVYEVCYEVIGRKTGRRTMLFNDSKWFVSLDEAIAAVLLSMEKLKFVKLQEDTYDVKEFFLVNVNPPYELFKVHKDGSTNLIKNVAKA